MDIFAEDESRFKIIKLLIFWLSLFVGCAMLLFVYQYEIKKPSKKTIMELNIAGKVNICSPDPIIDRKLYERF